MKNWYWIFFMCALVSSCLEDPDCLPTGDTAMILSFKKVLDGKADTVYIDSIVGTGADSIFYKTTPDKVDTLTSATVAVNPFADETLFTLYFRAGVVRTLRVGYKSEIRFISEECGSDRVEYDLTILETQFDSVRLVNNVLSKSRTTNIEIYY